jgi:hypothetical protein
MIATISVLIFLLVLYIIGGIRHKKAYDEWLKPDKYYIREIFRGMNSFLFTIMGTPVPKAFVDSSDGAYAKLTKEEVDECVDIAYQKMRFDDVTYSDAYEWRVFDCEDFAGRMKSEMTLAYRFQFAQTKRGAPFALFGYTKESGSKHVCLKAIADKKAMYYEVYPDHAGELKLTPKEVKSMDLELF